MTAQVQPQVCPWCKTKGYYFRKADQMFVCKKCGEAWPKAVEYSHQPNEGRKVSE